jgi:hypothetical protein
VTVSDRECLPVLTVVRLAATVAAKEGGTSTLSLRSPLPKRSRPSALCAAPAGTVAVSLVELAHVTSESSTSPSQAR